MLLGVPNVTLRAFAFCFCFVFLFIPHGVISNIAGKDGILLKEQVSWTMLLGKGPVRCKSITSNNFA